jgi:hypothetical protein
VSQGDSLIGTVEHRINIYFRGNLVKDQVGEPGVKLEPLQAPLRQTQTDTRLFNYISTLGDGDVVEGNLWQDFLKLKFVTYGESTGCSLDIHLALYKGLYEKMNIPPEAGWTEG